MKIHEFVSLNKNSLEKIDVQERKIVKTDGKTYRGAKLSDKKDITPEYYNSIKNNEVVNVDYYPVLENAEILICATVIIEVVKDVDKEQELLKLQQNHNESDDDEEEGDEIE